MMSNEDGLDWLARNVHEWPSGDHQPWCYVYFKGGNREVSGNCITVIEPCVRIEKADWLSHRSELQNKPGWADAPEWADWLAQDNSGLWYWYASKPTHPGMKSWWPVPGDENAKCGKGLVLGDWFDTLEKRPDMYKSEPEIDMSAGHVVKAAESMHNWYERGDLPPAGTACEFYISDRWLKAKVMAIWHDKVAFLDLGNSWVTSRKETLRPIRTEREVLIELLKSSMDPEASATATADAILAAGFKREGE